MIFSIHFIRFAHSVAATHFFARSDSVCVTHSTPLRAGKLHTLPGCADFLDNQVPGEYSIGNLKKRRFLQEGKFDE